MNSNSKILVIFEKDTPMCTLIGKCIAKHNSGEKGFGLKEIFSKFPLGILTKEEFELIPFPFPMDYKAILKDSVLTVTQKGDTVLTAEEYPIAHIRENVVLQRNVNL